MSIRDKNNIAGRRASLGGRGGKARLRRAQRRAQRRELTAIVDRLLPKLVVRTIARALRELADCVGLPPQRHQRTGEDS